MIQCYTMVGLPGSGKSTVAKSLPNYTTISTDAIREELFGDASCQKNGKLVFDTAYQRLIQCIAKNENVIFDATSLTEKDRKNILQYQAEHYAIFMNTPIEECKRRNARRKRKVPEEVIDRMAKRMQKPKETEGFIKVYEINPIDEE